MRQLRFIDLFAGIGGFRLGFEAAGHVCVFTSERDKFARKTYELNHSCDHPVIGDIGNVGSDDIPAHDILLAGFPCQPFSLMGLPARNFYGHETGFGCPTSGTAFGEIVRILEHHRPAGFLLENVSHLGWHDGGRTFKVIHRELTGLGYEVDYRVFDAVDFVPQQRRRLFMAGTRRSVGLQLDRLITPTVGPRLDTVLHPQDGTEAASAYTDDEGGVLSKYTISAEIWNGLRGRKKHHRLRVNPTVTETDLSAWWPDTDLELSGARFLLETNEGKANFFKYTLNIPADITRTLCATYSGPEILVVQPPARPRKITPREAARLMGYPDDFVIPATDIQAYKQFGNSVVPPLIAHIAKFITPAIERVLDADRKVV